MRDFEFRFDYVSDLKRGIYYISSNSGGIGEYKS